MTKHKEPADVAVLAARIMLAGCGCASRWRDDPSVPPPVSPYTAASLAERLCAIERAQRRHAERECSDERYVNSERLSKSGISNPATLAEARIRRQVEQWKSDLGMPCEIELAGDPRGAVVKLRLPGEAELTYV